MKALGISDPQARLAYFGKVFAALALLGAGSAAVRAQGQIASGTLSATGTGPYHYSLSFGDAANATAPIGSVWYAWLPDAFYLPSSPTAAFAPPGWTASRSGNSIEFSANAPQYYIAPGHTLAGFAYDATFSPAQLAASLNSGVSVAYSGGLRSDPGETFTVQMVAVPEPSIVSLIAGSAVGWFILSVLRRQG